MVESFQLPGSPKRQARRLLQEKVERFLTDPNLLKSLLDCYGVDESDAGNILKRVAFDTLIDEIAATVQSTIEVAGRDSVAAHRFY